MGAAAVQGEIGEGSRTTCDHGAPVRTEFLSVDWHNSLRSGGGPREWSRRLQQVTLSSVPTVREFAYAHCERSNLRSTVGPLRWHFRYPLRSWLVMCAAVVSLSAP